MAAVPPATRSRAHAKPSAPGMEKRSVWDFALFAITRSLSDDCGFLMWLANKPAHLVFTQRRSRVGRYISA
jgi:hypothetical protein